MTDEEVNKQELLNSVHGDDNTWWRKMSKDDGYNGMELDKMKI